MKLFVLIAMASLFGFQLSWGYVWKIYYSHSNGNPRLFGPEIEAILNTSGQEIKKKIKQGNYEKFESNLCLTDISYKDKNGNVKKFSLKELIKKIGKLKWEKKNFSPLCESRNFVISIPFGSKQAELSEVTKTYIEIAQKQHWEDQPEFVNPSKELGKTVQEITKSIQAKQKK